MARLGQSRDTAAQQFKNLENRLNHNPSLKADYAQFMQEYEALGHMRIFQGVDPPSVPCYYLPHHCVVKGESSTTKLRVVFNASCKTTTGISLNDCLMVGPVLQQNLFSIILRFRTFEYALIADITKMYRQVLVDESQVPLQRILWRSNPECPLKEFELMTLTYATSLASFLAIKSIRTLAEIEAKAFPIGSKIILRDFSVDDLISGANTKEQAMQIREETTKLLERGGFSLHKWASNEPTLIEDNHPESSAASAIRALNKEGMCKTLGILWNPVDDSLLYRIQVNMNKSQRVTKRTILSCVAQIFDPLGLLGPVIILAKILIQKLWTLRVDWDESLPMELHTQWNVYKSQLSQLNEIQIPRKVLEAQRIKNCQLHAFCDASQDAYGACVYLRTTTQDGLHSAKLLCAKSRVAPLKATTLPCLELCGALLLVQLVDKIIPVIELKIHAVYYWTDSTIVLGWIKSSSRKFNTFIANRIGEIQELTSIQSWLHVRTEDNPADIISRGVNPETLKGSELWWDGLHRLKLDESLWPQATKPLKIVEELPEQRKLIVSISTSQEDFDILERFSSYHRLIRTIAMCRRFLHNTSSSVSARNFGPISAQELQESRKIIIKRMQQVTFNKEIEDIKKQGFVKRDSHLIALSPFLDHQGLLRIGGRLKNADLSYAKHQLIMPAQHRLTRLIIENEHAKLLHAGHQATLGAIREKYWPLNARRMVRDVIHRCVICLKAKPRTSQQIMGDFPAARVTPARPFFNSGIDYCGPIFVREGRRRNARRSKAWIAVFVCLATKAIHIELVSDLTTEGFLNTLKRFISRRGKPSNIYSDNGTNFVGANCQLEELRALFNQEEFRHHITNSMAEDAITWHFIPPKAPHFGGLWESAIRSTKHHLNRVSSDGSLKFEEVTTLLSQIEAILNSRPLTLLSPDSSDYSYFTPGHFLVGDSLISYPEPSLQDLPLNRLSRWQQVEGMRQRFWKRWSVDYLNQLQQRSKWKRSMGPPIQIGQMIVVRENDMPPLTWLVGRVVSVHPGSDGIVRAASVKTSRGIFKRPASRICILPIET